MIIPPISMMKHISNLVAIHFTVEFVGRGTSNNSASNLTPTYPSGIQAGDLMIFHATTGHINDDPPNTPEGWELLTSVSETDGEEYGVDHGYRRVTIFTKIADGTETSGQNVSSTINSGVGSTGRATITVWRKPQSAIEWQINFSTATDPSLNTSVAINFDEFDFHSGDILLCTGSQLVDNATRTNTVLNATGITFGDFQNIESQAVATGYDHRHIIDYRPVTSDGNAAPYWNFTAGYRVIMSAVAMKLSAITYQ